MAGQEMGVTERVRFSDAVTYFAGGFGLGILFNIGDFVMGDLVAGWPSVFFYGVPAVALLWVVLPFQTRPFVLSAALFLGLVFGFLGGTLLVLNFYGAAG
jgi:hypothetical protein